MKLTRVGVDLAKQVFQVHGVDRAERPVWCKRLKRARWIADLERDVEPGAEVGMEACGSAPHWARVLQAKGYRVKLIAPQFVKPYVKTNKTDANDAEAICEAMSRPSMRFVAVKTVEQQDLQQLDERVRELDQEIALIAREHEAVGRLEQLRGIGPLTASALYALVGDARQYRNGREMAVSLGLTPRQHSSGGKERRLGISKRGDKYVRTLLIHGARSAL